MQPKIASRVTESLGEDECGISRWTAIHGSLLKTFVLATSALSIITTLFMPDETYWPVRRADNITIFMCRWSWQLGDSNTRKLMGLLEACAVIVFLHTISGYIVRTSFRKASETFVEFYKTTRRHGPEDGILPRHHRENCNCLWSRYRHYAMGWTVCVSNLARSGELSVLQKHIDRPRVHPASYSVPTAVFYRG